MLMLRGTPVNISKEIGDLSNSQLRVAIASWISDMTSTYFTDAVISPNS